MSLNVLRKVPNQAPMRPAPPPLQASASERSDLSVSATQTRSDEQDVGVNNTAIALLVSKVSNGTEGQSVDDGRIAGPANHHSPETTRNQQAQEPVQRGDDGDSDDSSSSEGRSVPYLNDAMRTRSTSILQTSESQRRRITSPHQVTSATSDTTNDQSTSFYGNKQPKRPKHAPPIPEAKKKERLKSKPPRRGFRWSQ